MESASEERESTEIFSAGSGAVPAAKLSLPSEEKGLGLTDFLCHIHFVLGNVCSFCICLKQAPLYQAKPRGLHAVFNKTNLYKASVIAEAA